jgi:hypothetical protein
VLLAGAFFGHEEYSDSNSDSKSMEQQRLERVTPTAEACNTNSKST